MRRFLFCFILLLLLLWCFALARENPSPEAPRAYFNGEIITPTTNAIVAATNTIDIAMFDLSDKPVIEALRNVQNKVKVRIIIDKRFARYFQYPTLENIEVKELGGWNGGFMHNKFIIFDKKTVMTGSYNISESARTKHHENVIFISDKAIVAEYSKEFNKLWDKAKEIRKK